MLHGVLIFGTGLIVGISGVFAQVELTEQEESLSEEKVLPADEGRTEEKDSFSFNGDRTSVNLSEGREYTALSGNAYVESGDITLAAEEIELYGEDFRYVTCVGSVRFVDAKNEIELEAQRLFFDRVSENATATGSIILDDKKNDLIARANSIEIFDESNRILFKIGVHMVQDDLFVRSELVVYNRSTEELRLEGFPSVIWGNDEYRALAMNINLDSEEVELIGRVSGSIVTDDDKTPEETAPEEQPEAVTDVQDDQLGAAIEEQIETVTDDEAEQEER